MLNINKATFLLFLSLMVIYVNQGLKRYKKCSFNFSSFFSIPLRYACPLYRRGHPCTTKLTFIYGAFSGIRHLQDLSSILSFQYTIA